MLSCLDIPDVPCRHQEATQLVSLLGHPEDSVPQSIFLVGHKSSGKSYTLMKVLQSLGTHFASVNCVEGYVPRLLFESILSQIARENLSPASRCDDIMDFILQLKVIADEHNLHNKIIAVVLEGSERLRDMNANLLPALMRLQELSCLKKICVIFLSDLLWDKFIPCGGLPPPIQIYFPQYSQSDILKILALDKPKDYPADFYLNYLQLFVAVFLRSCRDLTELRFKAAENFSKYCEPIEKGEIDINDSSKLWKHISPHLKASLEMIYMRFETGKKLATEIHCVPPVDKHSTLSSSAKYALSFELPYYAKYLIIAAYLASYNSPKEDKKLFVKLSGRTKKQVQKKNAQIKISSLVIGPRQFDLERLLAIFYSIIEEKPHISVNLLTQITSLVELQLLQKVGNDPLEAPKYKCAVGFDFIIIIAKTLSFNVTKYLVDYK
ncbi:Origin recognition complex subunit 5 [Frankliniella fusca]|uniref:Origin recognition complex subunit 5 n=1 Tax=Frankliniella fusca TaxID=407009 RepID=A0AAE1LGY0_9NEOP|nr:Origin recognition complex subunit 5 [Frankliniella fusca]KAK3924743.1 Origin recognition complex subunit 5 [Frankliniella fusca]